MGSLGGDVVKRRKAMWLYPKVAGFNPSERWGHSACCSDGVVYIFGGCCGGLHFSDVLALNLETMAWSSLVTTGQKPGTRDSHTATLVGHKMVIFGGTNGSKKVNDINILDLKTKEWSLPSCKGVQPSPRESHTATVIGDHNLVIFGGSGEGEANYLNDVHILDLKTMTWTSPELKCDRPTPRDSHTAVAIGNKLYVYGGDCGDHYHGEVDVLDMKTMIWSRLPVQGPTPGFRAGHAAVKIGIKIYIIGGVGDKQYYNDVWVLDVEACSWDHLDIRGQQPQGRFSHAAVFTETDIAIYGGCGEDERPLNELLILQLGSEHPNGRYNISMCKIFGKNWIHEKRKFLRTENLQKSAMLHISDLSHKSSQPDVETRNPMLNDNAQTKRRRISDARVWDVESEQEEHSLSMSQHSSPSQSDQEQNMIQKLPNSGTESNLPGKQHARCKMQHQQERLKLIQRNSHNVQFSGSEPTGQLRTEPLIRTNIQSRQEVHFLTKDQNHQLKPAVHPLIGAEVFGTVDGAFDSGYLMTANVNGQILRGVLFTPGPCTRVPRSSLSPQGLTCPVAVSQNCSSAHAIPVHAKPPQRTVGLLPPGCINKVRQPQQVEVAKIQAPNLNSDLHGVILTLGGPGS